MAVIKVLYEHRAEVVEAVFALGGLFGYTCAIFAHLPFVPVQWQERFARGSVWASKAFSVNKRPKVATPDNPIAPVGDR